ncbi:MAG: MOSC domain-containing protein [Pedobacter sp.]|nr:MAG: MOSC domain-containing protein [Pedobacter sp.]
MDTLQLSGIYIYPIKSLGGISLSQATVESKGLRYDRRWMLIDAEGTFVSQRKYASLALLQVEMQDEQILVYQKNAPSSRICFPANLHQSESIRVSIWDDLTIAFEVDSAVSEWFSAYLEFPVKLVMMSEETRREVDPRYASANEIVSFADGYPILIIGQSSLNLLNEKLDNPVPMNRFRPNLVFSGGEAHLEDSFNDFSIGEVIFTAVKPCARCVLITVDQHTGEKSSEPLKTLSRYRLQNNKVMFGQNLLHKGSGDLKIGDRLKIRKWKERILS